MKCSSISKISGNEVYHTISLILLVKIMLCSELLCHKYFQLKCVSYTIASERRANPFRREKNLRRGDNFSRENNLRHGKNLSRGNNLNGSNDCLLDIEKDWVGIRTWRCGVVPHRVTTGFWTDPPRGKRAPRVGIISTVCGVRAYGDIVRQRPTLNTSPPLKRLRGTRLHW